MGICNYRSVRLCLKHNNPIINYGDPKSDLGDRILVRYGSSLTHPTVNDRQSTNLIVHGSQCLTDDRDIG